MDTHTSGSTNGSSATTATQPLEAPATQIDTGQEALEIAKEALSIAKQFGERSERNEATSRELEKLKEVKSHPLSNTLRFLGEVQGGLLIILVGVYTLGYLVWAFNAKENNLGMLPAIQVQYFVAGFIPAVLVWGAWLIVKYGAWAAHYFEYLLVQEGPPAKINYRRGLIHFLLGTVSFVAICYYLGFLKTDPNIFAQAFVLIILTLLVFLALSVVTVFLDTNLYGLEEMLSKKKKGFSLERVMHFAENAGRAVKSGHHVPFFWIYPLFSQTVCY